MRDTRTSLADVLTDSEAATLRAACEIAVDFWKEHGEKSNHAWAKDMAKEQQGNHERMLERIQGECGV